MRRWRRDHFDSGTEGGFAKKVIIGLKLQECLGLKQVKDSWEKDIPIERIA